MAVIYNLIGVALKSRLTAKILCAANASPLKPDRRFSLPHPGTFG